ncbi:hypothetical protein ACFLTH_13065 [Bacteroidota bacterium]
MKEKDKLLHEAKPISETAKDLYGGSSTSANNKIEQAVPEKTESKALELPGEGEALPNKFVDEEIEEMNLQKSEISRPAKDEAHGNAKTSLMSQKIGEDLREEKLQNFGSILGDSLGSGEGDVKEPPAIKSELAETFLKDSDKLAPNDKTAKNAKSSSESKFAPIKPYQRDEGFFHDFEKFLNNRNLDEDFISEILDKDLFHKMKQFHLQRDEGTPFFFRHEDSDRDLVQKLEELKLLEEEWFIRQRNLKEAEVSLLEKEAEIDIKLEDLKNVLKHIKQREKLEKKADKENYFNLEDGRVLRSIANLREALKNMKNDLFDYHVSEKKNDFADWVEHVFGNHDLATKMKLSTSRKALLDVLYDF